MLNKRNKDVILRKSNYFTVAGRDEKTADELKNMVNSTIVFSITEPDPSSFVPQVSSLKMGTLIEVNEGTIVKI